MSKLQDLEAACLSCTACPLSEGDSRVSSPHVFGRGNANASIMIVGQNPGADEVKNKRPFMGVSGKNLDKMLADHLGLKRSDIYVTNTVKCYTTSNRAPKANEVKACRHFLEEEIRIVQPDILVALGNTALKYLTGKTGISMWRGQVIYSELFKVDVFPTWHPSPQNMNKAIFSAMAADDFQDLKQYLDDKSLQSRI